MSAVFLGGSRRISRLNDKIRAKLDDFMSRGLWLFVGDANGADRAMQEHLARQGCQNVVVYCVVGHLRNNVGRWQVHAVEAPRNVRGFELYSLKDAEMARDADYGFMLWDGKSRGTLANIDRLLKQGKPVAVYLGPARRIVSLDSPGDLWRIGVEPAVELERQEQLPFGGRRVGE